MKVGFGFQGCIVHDRESSGLHSQCLDLDPWFLYIVACGCVELVLLIMLSALCPRGLVVLQPCGLVVLRACGSSVLLSCGLGSKVHSTRPLILWWRDICGYFVA